MRVESILYNKLDDNKVKCNICNHRCVIPQNHSGYCNLRENIDGILYFNNYGILSLLNIDPIEKKPLYHFLPSSLAYSVGGFSCNMSCLACQNYMISQESYNKNIAIEISPEDIVKNAINHNCSSIAYTYNEPTVSLEYVLDIASIACENNIKNLFISNAYMTSETLEYILPYIDAFNIDLKFIEDSLYKKVCNAKIDRVLENLKIINESNTHLEITNLLIDNLNDSKEDIEKLVNFILNELSNDIPLHFSRSFPYFKMMDIEPTKKSRMINSYNIAKDMGMEYVYLGNINFNQNTYCPECGEILIKRNGYFTSDLGKIINGKCSSCGKKLNFVLC
ncbi:AmmeMemoRadiSam system radical SAM enzyme [Methanobrevibacter sp. 87.7]|uniref:AmmeMemoRadiSam system radical SAM enzyme n=1 Tax=Methanobrevibacter sp. 87.7 TaxID=387957 RepID=UPI000B502037|nr:AmmeMemoRadiSam system radical SAM enzyme [Methanobrevibacter sp. 87.7]OWT33482.1 AmmeMemoRadiSam system radical SAM enzyme [Methanobrevibacter sp. 87.7]